ncbi:MAG: 50S ribosomal protein L7Ae [Candidatus Marsarchaeota archaeon]|jgi:large subunit ribosomal protein L7Ae|nr:50S ribosomal protein L7Ae [Candidatus Marsarchaeota archaeon]
MKSYIKFEVSKEVADKTYEALRLAKDGGVIKKGANEVTKSVERGLASFVVIAEDVEPEEVVLHIPMLCEQKKIPFTYVPNREALGKAIGMSVQCAAVSVEGQGGASAAISDIISKITGSKHSPKGEKAPHAAEPKKEHPAAEEKKAPHAEHAGNADKGHHHEHEHHAAAEEKKAEE